jgi:hypothetical protein
VEWVIPGISEVMGFALLNPSYAYFKAEGSDSKKFFAPLFFKKAAA